MAKPQNEAIAFAMVHLGTCIYPLHPHIPALHVSAYPHACPPAVSPQSEPQRLFKHELGSPEEESHYLQSQERTSTQGDIDNSEDVSEGAPWKARMFN